MTAPAPRGVGQLHGVLAVLPSTRIATVAHVRIDQSFPKVVVPAADDTEVSGPTFSDIRRQFGTSLALAWIAMLWRFGLLGAGGRDRKARVRYARRRSPGRVMSAAEWIVLAIVGGGWLFWAFLMVKGVIAYTHHGH
jgi:hypothetical protein